MKKLNAVLVAVLFVAILGTNAFAYDSLSSGDPGDTPAGTPLTSESNSANYRDQNLNPRDPIVGAPSYTVVVTGEYGWWAPDTDVISTTTTRGVPRTWMLHLQNEGNAPFTFTFTYEVAYSTSPAATNWLTKVYFVTSESQKSEIPSGQVLTIPDDGFITIEGYMLPSNVAAESPDGSSGMLNWSVVNSRGYPVAGTTTAEFGGVVLHGYIGVRDFTYGAGLLELNYPSSLEITSPVIAFTRTSTVDSPNNYVIGTKHDAVPGSLVTNIYNVSNEGTGNSQHFMIIDRVPANVVPYYANLESGTNVTFTGPRSENYADGSGWSVFTTSTDEAYLDKTWENPTSYGWESRGIMYSGGGPMGESLSLPANATFVMFRPNAGNINSGGYAKLTWSGIIK